jgi:predicted nuclease of predicted toxin-antitoxin system
MTENNEGEFSFLYIHLYFDEDVSVGIVENLQTRGFDVLSARDAGALGKADDEQMLYAVSERRAVVTHNRADFEKQHVKFLESGMNHYGVIAVKRRKDAEVVNKLLALLEAVTAEEMKNQLRYI